MKASLVYALLIVVVVVVVSLFARSNVPVRENSGNSLASPGNNPIEQEAPTLKREEESDSINENSIETRESVSGNADDQ